MNYKKVISGLPGTSVIFELENGRFAIVSLGRRKIQVSSSLDSFYRFAQFKDAGLLPQEDIDEAIEILKSTV